jgi:uncharacterized protein YjbJ (UPF0337 family)
MSRKCKGFLLSEVKLRGRGGSLFAEPAGRANRFESSEQNRRNKMNRDQMEGNWKQFSGKAKEHWGKLTDDDLDVVAGKREQLEGKIQERYGKSKDEAKKEVDNWFDRNGW